MTGAVLDASVAIKLVVDEAGTDQAVQLLDGRRLYAPPLLFVEAANVLWRLSQRKILSADETDDALAVLRKLPLSPLPQGFDPVPDALRLSRLLEHPVYDCVYLAVAVEVGQPFITADRRFIAAATRHADVAALVQPLV